ncbi:trafficking protein particle complex subunit 12 [Entomortierella parvispora]|uniref:Trafficking protein particle complex subunit 12 n=1 Tax=Entomortierella parvispora TaxID=205924 RepID=A0A9P3M0W2_9FUNG|nr:trafficking protein particle complex subunit 12 [Entomortierella parvispora]
MSRSIPFEDPLLHPSTPPIEAAAAPSQQIPAPPTKQVDDGPIPFASSPSAADDVVFSPPPFHSATVSSRAATPSITPAPTIANVASVPAFDDPLQSAFEDHVEKSQQPHPPTRQQALSPDIGIPASDNSMPTEFPTHLASPPLPQRPPSMGGTSFSAFQAFSTTLQPPTVSGTPVSTNVSGTGTPIQNESSSTIPLNNESTLSLPPLHPGTVGLGLGAHDHTTQQAISGSGSTGQWNSRRLSMGVSTNPSGIINSRNMPDMIQEELKSPQQESDARHYPLSDVHQGFSSPHQERLISPTAQPQLHIKPLENIGREHSGLRSPSFAVPPSPMRSQGFPILNSPNMFHEINMADAMNDLMVRHIPAEHRTLRDWSALTEAEQRQASRSEILHELTINNSWRAMTRYTRSQILATPSDRIVELINLWYARLLALTKLGQYEMAQAELDQLGDLRGPQYRFESYPPEAFDSSLDFQTNEQRQGESRKRGSIVPFELLVLKARLQGHLGDIYEAIDQLYDLVLLCKKFEAICKVGEDISGELQWLSLSGQLHIMVLNYLIELKDYPAATRHARDLAKRYPHDINFHSGLGRLYLQLGDLDSAQIVFQRVEDQVKALPDDGKEKSHFKLQLIMNRALLAVATGEWITARDAFEEVLVLEPENLVATNNLAVCELYAGQLNEAIPRIEKLMFAYPTSAGTSEPLVFNMATLHELRTEGSLKKKQQMLVEVSQWAGDQFNVGVFKI